MSTSAPRGLASIIVPCWNQLEFTRHCVAALKKHTRQPWELIAIDNGSTDQTGVYLAGVRDGANVPVRIISNTTNRGFPAAINQGLKAARGEYLVLLNNDVVVTDGWLEQLVGLVNARRGVDADGAEHAETGAPAGRPTVDTGAGSGDPRRPPVEPRIGDESGPIAAEATETRVGGAVRPTPPGPPFTRGGKVLAPPSVDPARAGVEEGEPCAAPASLPTADRLLPTVRPIGLVGPMSNYATAPQLVENVPYHDLREMHKFARLWRDEHRGKWFTAHKLSGFCLLMKRSVYEKIGGLDERFGLGFFDDDDLAERARRAGFELAVAHDLFVHHFGSRTFQGNGVDAGKLLDENARRFAAKWGLKKANGKPVALRPWSASPGFFADSQREFAREVDAAVNPARISLTMIVRDEENNLSKCLESVRGLFDEIVIVDTGSIDRTKEIAREFGAKVFDFVWIDDFAAARNEALAHATGDYAFWLDADDVVDPPEREKLRVLFRGLRRSSMGGAVSAMSSVTPPLTRPAGDLSPGRGDNSRPGEADAPALSLGAGLPTPPMERPQVSPPQVEPRSHQARAAAYVMRCACPPGHDGARGGTVVDHVRLFPIRPGVRWTYRVHEQILPSLNRAKIPARWTDVVIRHDGYTDPDVEARKLERNIKILERELIERPDDPFVLFNLGASAVQQKDYHAALGLLERSLALSLPRDSIVRKLYALIARVHQMTGDSQEALQTCAAGLKLDPQDAELWHRKAVIHRHRGESAEAERSWRRILELKRPEQYCSFDDGIYGHVTRRNLAVLAAERGDFAEARRLWNEVLAECPGDREALAKLGRMPAETTHIGPETAGEA